MAINPLEDRLGVEVLKSCLEGTSFGDFRHYKVTNSWDSHHAVLQRVVLSFPDKEDLPIVIKKFVPPKHSSDPVYSLMHDPSFLYTREKTNLSILLQHLPRPKLRSGETLLVPELYGFNDNLKLIVSEDLGNKNMNKHLLDADPDRRTDLFTRGIKIIGRFVGTCNRYRNELEAAGEYQQNAEAHEKYSLALQVENLLRLYYRSNSGCQQKIGRYDSGQVRQYINLGRNNLDVNVKDLNDQRTSALCEESILQHNDCNGRNIVKGRLVDLEDFGLGSWTTDISSYCIIVGLGNNAILRDNAFGHFRHLYLAYEHFYRTTDLAGLTKTRIRELKNGNLSNIVKEQVFKGSEQRYADWTFSFLASAIDKNIQLAATFSRYDDANGKDASSHMYASTLTSLAELFSTLGRIETRIDHCTNPSEVRRYFYNYGRLLLDLGVFSKKSREEESVKSSIYKINHGVIANNLDQYWPF
jgi:hypothetical protein